MVESAGRGWLHWRPPTAWDDGAMASGAARGRMKEHGSLSGDEETINACAE